MLIDRVFRIPRRWSNQQLRRFAHRFSGDVVNVSAWMDSDKEGGSYRDYFTAARSYAITNHPRDDSRGVQGARDEIQLDLTARLPDELKARFDVVFNHTTLEHIYDFQTAFANLCEMSRDVVIVVVPWLQQFHRQPGYGDYWRFSPLATKRLLEDHGLTPLEVSFNNDARSSIYVFALGTKQPEKWRELASSFQFTERDPRSSGRQPFAGSRSIQNPLVLRGWRRLQHLLGKDNKDRDG